MNKVKVMSIITALAVVMLLVAACTNDDAPQSTTGVSQAAGAFSGGVQGQSGISVSGEGSVDLVPDLALLNVGVEAMAESVSQARDEAAQAMDAIIAAVKAHGLEDRDIQTRAFNIWPQYQYHNDGRSTLVGYTVNNSATVKIRDINNVGPIIDDVANAGGNATRIDGIRFTVEDPKPYMAALREAAFQDAMAKAEHLATLAGVELGPLTFVTESSGAPVVREAAFAAMEAAAPSTSISGGELRLSMYVQAVFDIR